MPKHNPVPVEVINRDKRGDAAVIRVIEHDHEGQPVEGGVDVKVTGGKSWVGELGGGHKIHIEAE